MNANTWNTLVLPFSIEEDIVLKTFGAGTVYAELKGAIDKNAPTTIYFDRTRDGIKKNTLYLIKPTNKQPEDGNNVRSSSNKNGNGESTETDYALAFTEEDGKNSYWTFEAVDFGNDKEDNNDVDFKDKVYGDNVKETYSEVNIRFAGTYISDGGKPQGGNNQNEEKFSIPKNSYVLSGKATNNSTVGTWYFRTKETHSKGFRGWLEEVQTSTSPARTSIFVDGVEWPIERQATGIESILNGKKIVIVGKGVYNLQGQRVREGSSLEGLASGIYIVNGKKVLVK